MFLGYINKDLHFSKVLRDIQFKNWKYLETAL